MFTTQQKESQVGAILNSYREAHMETEEALSVGVLWTTRTGLGQNGRQQLEEEGEEKEKKEKY